MVVTMAMTIASLGRSTKIADSIGSAPSNRLRYRAGADRYAGAHVLQSFDDDELAAGQPFIDDDVRPALGARLDAPDDGLAVVDHKHIDAALIGDQRGLRDDHSFLRLAAFEIDAHQLPIDQRA